MAECFACGMAGTYMVSVGYFGCGQRHVRGIKSQRAFAYDEAWMECVMLAVAWGIFGRFHARGIGWLSRALHTERRGQMVGFGGSVSICKGGFAARDTIPAIAQRAFGLNEARGTWQRSRALHADIWASNEHDTLEVNRQDS